MRIADVCANVPIKTDKQFFSYIVPDGLNHIGIGWRVIVPFGAQKIDGFIMNVYDGEPGGFGFELKTIESAVDDEAWFTPTMIFAAKWLANFYLSPLSQTMTLFMPGRVSKKISARFEKTLEPAVEINDELLASFKSKRAQLKILTELRSKKFLPSSEFNRSLINKLIEAGVIVETSRRVIRDSYASLNPIEKNFELTIDQKQAIESVGRAIEARKHLGFLLHGVTGSGKTLVYIELAARVRSLGRRAVILVPEIALTGQIVVEFKRRFGDVIVIHSRLSIAERSDAFHKIRSGECGIVIGARSALFTPIDNVGLFVIDEEQDQSYKQGEAPHYHARVVAEQFARLHSAPLVLGSATPSLESYHRALNGELELLRLPNRIDGRPLPKVECVDMRAELKSGNRSVLSSALLDLLKSTLERKEQAIVLLNRRGYSTFVMCRSCGAVVKCLECRLPMIYHADGKLRCHRCETECEPPKTCPKCGSKYIKYFGAGTQKLEQTLEEELPAARILRMDRDTTTKKLAHQKMLEQFRARDFDILFGTQMVAKGHDISGVTAVGILSADACLNFPSFRSSETCFMLITQAAGRAGRADREGRVIVQAYNPEHEAIRFGCRQDYEGFFNDELPKREELFYPPFSRLIKLLIVGKDEKKTRERAEEIADSLRAEFEKESEGRTEALGPAAAMIPHWRELYRFVILIKTNELDRVRNLIRAKGLNWRDDVTIDIDPIDIL